MADPTPSALAAPPASAGSTSPPAYLAGAVVDSITVGTYPCAIGYDPRDGDVYVANIGSGNVSVLSGTTVIGTIKVGISPCGIAYDSGDGDVYISNRDSNDVSVISGMSVVDTIDVGDAPYGVGYDSTDQDIYVTNEGSSNVTVISGTNVVGNVNVGTYPFSVAYDGGNGDVYVANDGSGNVSVISGTSLVGAVNVGTAPIAVACDNMSGEIYVANEGSNNVSVISGMGVVGSVNVGSHPDAVAYDPASAYLYVANLVSSNVSVISGTIKVGAFEVGTYPDAVTYDGGDAEVYIANHDSGNVSVVATILELGLLQGRLGPDSGQVIFLSAPLVYGNPGINETAVSTLPATGLDCIASPATATNVSTFCTSTASGTFRVNVTAGGDGGNVWTSILVTVYPEPSVSTPSANRTSADVGQTVLFTTVASGGPGTYLRYSWTFPGALGCAPSNASTLVCVPITQISDARVGVNVTDADNETSSTETVAYTVLADPTIATPFASRASLDVGQSTTLSVASSPVTGSTIAWYNLPYGCSNQNSTMLTCAPSVAGSYNVSASIRDVNGLKEDSHVLVLNVSQALGIPSVTASAQSVDAGAKVIFTTSFSGGAAPYVYAWTGLPSGCANTTAKVVTCTPGSAGTFSISVVVTDANGARNGPSSIVSVTVQGPPKTGSTGIPISMIDWVYGIGVAGTVVVVALAALIRRRRMAGGTRPSPSVRSQDDTTPSPSDAGVRR